MKVFKSFNYQLASSLENSIIAAKKKYFQISTFSKFYFSLEEVISYMLEFGHKRFFVIEARLDCSDVRQLLSNHSVKPTKLHLIEYNNQNERAITEFNII